MDMVGERGGRIHPSRPHVPEPARPSVSDTVHVLCVPATHRAERHVPRKYTDGSRCYTERQRPRDSQNCRPRAL